ncbi:peroxiredoxin type-2 [Purpureocillium lilacinum]|nr:peroxiredoxin type-2 [Purpureocillium lilacinum]OAQ86297.1 peroxiredoxin type-2 [Purpureocillium lilacinum]OAQ94257.1 peroxiredoxin type-2 [Purpureocillium lilacinum]PWI71192.1 redoxin [Purpureocillium lilacinum]GJN67451.1 hypothetical protein PLICBS_001476 [Purpureocillium lilacinum]GJN81358.1 hypothetical protein PLIIFM63780_004891 [Purpureocillium lilacinum]
MSALKVGDSFPEDVAFTYVPPAPESDIKVCGIPQKFDASKEFKNKKVVLVSVPGAFTPTCQASHLPSYLNNRDALKQKGVDQVVVIAFNDAFVMSAWGKANGVTDDYVIFASDADAKFSKSIGWTIGERTSRYAIAVDHGKVVYASQEDNTKSIDQSGAEAVLAKL